MNKRHPTNTNLRLHHESEWNSIPVQTLHGPLIQNYLERIHQTLSYALTYYARVCVIRFDLRIPQQWPVTDSAVISRFIEALQWQLDESQRRSRDEGKRQYTSDLRYVWAKERDTSMHSHYHVAIILNKDAYFSLGKAYRPDYWFFTQQNAEAGRNMAERIINAWATALNAPPGLAQGAVHFPDNCLYTIDRNGNDYQHQFNEVFYRLSYLAKMETKNYGDHSNQFGCSRH